VLGRVVDAYFLEQVGVIVGDDDGEILLVVEVLLRIDDSPVSVRRRPRPGRNAVWRRRTVIDMIVSIFDRIISSASSGCNHPDRWQICRSLGGLAVILTVASVQFSTKTESPIPPRLAPCYLS